MAYNQLISNIKNYIKENGRQEITGQIMQDALVAIINALSTYQQFGGMAADVEVPDTENNVFYFAAEGSYPVFGNLEVGKYELAVFIREDDEEDPEHVTWRKETIVELPEGPQGEQGPKGEQGPQGEQGITGQRGADAVNPFKGWWPDLATLKAAITAQPGDSAYVKDASPATTWSIYVYDATASSDNYWADSGTDADTSNVQTFASGEEVNETNIDDTHIVNPKDGALAKAEDVMQLKVKLDGVTANEVKASYVAVPGYKVQGNGVLSSNSVAKYTTIPLNGAKSVRFLGVNLSSSSSSSATKNTGYCFGHYNGEEIESNWVIDTYYAYEATADTSVKKEYIAIPTSVSTHLRTNVAYSAVNENNFYCYLQSGESVVDLIPEVVNNLEDGGIDKALSAEQGKIIGNEVFGSDNGQYVTMQSGVNYYTDKYYNGTIARISGSEPGGSLSGCVAYKVLNVQGRRFKVFGKGSTNSVPLIIWADADRYIISVVTGNYLGSGYIAVPPEGAAIMAGNFQNYNAETCYVQEWESEHEDGLVDRVRDLEDNMPSQVQVIDNLESSSTTNALSANQGKELNNKKVNVKAGKNLYTGNNDKDGKYINSSGGESVNGSFAITDYIPVEPGSTYFASASNYSHIGSSSSGYAQWYNSSKVAISLGVNTATNDTFTAPEGAAYMRLTYNKNRLNIMVEKGATQRTSYEPYTEIGGYYANIENGQVNYEKLSNDVKGMFDSAVVRLGSFRHVGTLQAGATYYDTAGSNSVKKESIYSALIIGIIDGNGVSIGVGASQSAYMGYKVTVDATNLKITRLDTGSTVAYAHGLTLTSRTTLTIETVIASKEELNTGTSVDDVVSKTIITISDDLGNSFVKLRENTWGYGVPFITNDTNAAIEYTIDYFPKDLDANVWVFSDSYSEFTYRNRFPYYLWKNGYTHFLLNGHGGYNQTQSLEQLNALLSLGKRPSFIVWLLGMNDGNDTYSDDTYTVNSTAKQKLDAFIALCNSKNITPILCAVPSVSGDGGSNPARRHHGLAAYVRSLGYRYIDWAQAVGSQPGGTWNTGLLGSDGVHPTTEGSYVLYRQILADFPEIATTK